jgi:Domain of unknown function (DUF5666)
MRICQVVAKRSFLFLLLAAQLPLLSQIQWPHRGKQTGAESKSAQTQRSTGKLTKIDEQSIVVEVPDGRVIEFKRTPKTKFFRETQEIKAEELKPGDQVTVDATADQEGYLYAGNVTLVKRGPPGAAAAPPPAAAEPSAAEPPENGGRAPGNIPAPPEASEDSGPPRLTHVASGERRKAEPENAADTPDTPTAGTPARTAGGARAEEAETAASGDAVIEKARAAVAAFTQKLPNYVCKEFMARYESVTRPADWKPLDVVSTNIVYEGGRESYRDVEINGKPQHKAMEEISGAWSTGEFGTMLLGIFAPWTAAEFRLRRAGSIAGVEARVYNFEVDRAHSNWHVRVASQSMIPAYKGAVWIEPETGRVMRLEMQARALPKEFPLDTVESAVDYENVMIGGAKFLLPVHAETLACDRGTSNCSRSAIDFRNYHKFEATSDVTFSEK